MVEHLADLILLPIHEDGITTGTRSGSNDELETGLLSIANQILSGVLQVLATSIVKFFRLR
jgi:hypothetical protein